MDVSFGKSIINKRISGRHCIVVVYSRSLIAPKIIDNGSNVRIYHFWKAEFFPKCHFVGLCNEPVYLFYLFHLGGRNCRSSQSCQVLIYFIKRLLHSTQVLGNQCRRDSYTWF